MTQPDRSISMSIPQALKLAIEHHDAGRLPQAEAIYRQILAARPGHVDALNLLGRLALQVGKLDAAADLILRAIDIAPDFADGHFNLGNVLLMNAQYEPAIAAYRRAISLRPHLKHAHEYLGAALVSLRKWDEAIVACREAIARDPNCAAAFYNLGSALYETRRFEDAIAAYRRALSLRPDFPEAMNNLANALRANGDLASAIENYRRCISLRADHLSAHINLSETLKDSGEFDQADQTLRRALELKPDSAEAHYNLATMFLLRGDFARGWQEFEWRWKSGEFPPRPEYLTRPRWDGSPLNGKRILIHCEQGFGDSIQFSRYLPTVTRRGGKIILACPPELKRLLARIDGVEQVVDHVDAQLQFDFQCPLLSLPGVFGTTLQTIPGQTPYLQADTALIESWREKMPGDNKPRVGLAWAGRPTHRRDQMRSIDSKMLEPLMKVTDVTYFSLQKRGEKPSSLPLLDWTDQLHDFADTAALISQLDLVIAVDTAVAHLAAALGKSVWLLLSYVPDWRWLLDREDSPWYPTMRLFRQPRLGEWEAVIEKVVDALGEFRITSDR